MWTITRTYSLTIGIAFILAGIAGFLPLTTIQPGIDAPTLLVDANYGYLLGLFPINLIHNLFHFSTGVIGVWSSRTEYQSLQYCKVIGIILLILMVMGLLPQLATLGGLMPLFGHDIWLHGLEAALALILGFFWNAEKSRLQWRAI